MPEREGVSDRGPATGVGAVSRDPAAAVIARVLHPGCGSGRALAIAPVSFWGGVSADGTVADVHHPAHGESLVGRALVMETSKGSSSGSSVLAELIVAGHAPALIVVSEPDAVIVSGCLAAAEISGVRLPVVQVTRADLVRLGEAVRLGGAVRSSEAARLSGARSLSVDCAETPIGELTRVRESALR